MVKSFYYTMSVSMDGANIEPVSNIKEEEDSNSNSSSGMFGGMRFPGGQMGGMGFRPGSMGEQGDFTLVGYSSDEAMENFLDGVSMH